jgi:hypothetical protein
MIKERNNLAKSGDRNSTGTQSEKKKLENLPSFVPYNLLTQHSIPDKSIADCVEGMCGINPLLGYSYLTSVFSPCRLLSSPMSLIFFTLLCHNFSLKFLSFPTPSPTPPLKVMTSYMDGLFNVIKNHN